MLSLGGSGGCGDRCHPDGSDRAETLLVDGHACDGGGMSTMSKCIGEEMFVYAVGPTEACGFADYMVFQVMVHLTVGIFASIYSRNMRCIKLQVASTLFRIGGSSYTNRSPAKQCQAYSSDRKVALNIDTHAVNVIVTHSTA